MSEGAVQDDGTVPFFIPPVHFYSLITGIPVKIVAFSYDAGITIYPVR